MIHDVQLVFSGIALAGLASFLLGLLAPANLLRWEINRPTLLGLGLIFTTLGFGISAALGGF